jgi:hypothetical protein
MATHKLGVRIDRNRIFLVLTEGHDELLRARLPQPIHPLQDKPLLALLESLAVWLDTQLLVVLSADEPSDGFFLGLTDERGVGRRTEQYDVVVVERLRRRSTLKKAPEFKEMRQLCLHERRTRSGQ